MDSFGVVIEGNHFEDIGFVDLNVQEGAALYISRTSTSTSIIDNSFINCRAYAGGAISWKNFPPTMSGNYFSNNSAVVYGDDQASYAVGLEFRTRANLPSIYLETRKLT